MGPTPNSTETRDLSLRRAALRSVGWVALALAFGAALWAWQGPRAGSEYLAGYLLERSLSLDNLFVFAVIFGSFAVPRAEQPRLLGWGIALALALRLVFIVAGTLLLGALHVTFYAFGALLLVTAYKLGRHGDGDVDPASNPVLGLVRRRGVSPTVAVLVVIATTDLMFAVDSIPAIFAVTTNPWIVFAANAFAMLGLRSLYFVLAGMMDRFTYMSVGLSAILAFIGVKMLLVDVWHPPVWLPLAVVAGVLAVAVGLSLRTGAGLQSAGAPSTASR